MSGHRFSEHLSTGTDPAILCPCGCKTVENYPDIISQFLIQGFEKIRNYLKTPIHINSGYRCSWYQQKMREKEVQSKMELYGLTEEELFAKRLIWHSMNSPHCKGIALDVRVNNLDNIKLLAIAAHMGFCGLGLYPWGCHIDVRKDLTVWNRT